MEFESAQQTAERLGVTVRTVQKWAKSGKLPGAKQIGRSWLIPADISAPTADPVSQDDRANAFTYHTILPLMNGSYMPGHCLEYIQAMEDPDDRAIAMGEYYYFTGNPERAVKEVELYLTHTDFGLSFSACIVCFLANRVLGKTSLAHYALERSRALIKEVQIKTDDPRIYALAVYQQAFIASIMRLTTTDTVPLETVLRFLPEGMKLFATYLVAYNAHRAEEHARSLGMAETALAFPEKPYPIAQICLLIISAIDLVSMKRVEEAKANFLRAWREANPDGLIELFGEHYGLLQGITENCLRRDHPEEFKRVIEIAKNITQSWRKMRAADSYRYPSDTLSPTEFTVATLISRNWTIREIAEHLALSNRMVKYHISVIYQKLGIANREELRQYMTY